MEASSEISFDSSFVERSSSPVISSGLDSSTVRARRHRTFEEQLADRNTPPLDSVNSRMPRESLATATYKGNRYVREDALASKNKRPRSSAISQHGIFVTQIDAEYRSLGSFWVCRLCDLKGSPKLFKVEATTGPKKHLKTMHPQLFQESDATSASKTPQKSVLSIQVAAAARNRCKIEPASNVELAKRLVLGWIVSSNLPFTLLENPYLRRLLQLLDTDLTSCLSMSKNTVARELRALFQRQKELISQQLHESQGLIHLTFDCWTSANVRSYISIHAHFLDREYKVRTLALGFPRHFGRHDGKNLAGTIMATIKSFGIEGRIGASVCDNAGNNDKLTDELYALARPSIRPALRKHFRLRCYGHILNLAAKAFFYGMDDDANNKELVSSIGKVDQKRALGALQGRSPVKKLHNLVRFVRVSSQRRELFEAIARHDVPNLEELLGDTDDAVDHPELMLVQNNDTRWNSTYLMIERAIKLRPNIEMYLSYLDASRMDSISASDRLSASDWALLCEIQAILKQFYDQTKRTEGRAVEAHHGSLWEVLASMEYLRSYLETKVQEYTVFKDTIGDLDQDNRIFLAAAVNLAWAKLEAYYNKLRSSPLYAGAFILHPALNYARLSELWSDASQQAWLDEADHDLRAHFDAFYPTEPAAESTLSAGRNTANIDSGREENSSFEDFIISDSYDAQEPAEDELTRYYREPRLTKHNTPDRAYLWNPLQWWRHRMAGVHGYKRLGRFALDVHAIPATSCEPERTFSQAKLIQTTQRQRISDEALEHLICLKSWESYGGLEI